MCRRNNYINQNDQSNKENGAYKKWFDRPYLSLNMERTMVIKV